MMVTFLDDLKMSDFNTAESTGPWTVVQNGVVSEEVTNVWDGQTGKMC